MTVSALEPWLDKKGLAAHFGVSVRWIDYRIAEGMPSAIIGRHRKFRASEAEAWLERAGHIVRDR